MADAGTIHNWPAFSIMRRTKSEQARQPRRRTTRIDQGQGGASRTTSYFSISASEISFHKRAAASWVFFFSHSADFTPVCTTEIGKIAKLVQQFAARNTKPLGLSTDTVSEHLKWIKDVNDTQKTDFQFPIVADADLRVAKLYDMIRPAQSDTAQYVQCSSSIRNIISDRP